MNNHAVTKPLSDPLPGAKTSDTKIRKRSLDIVNKSLPGRYRAERRFRWYGLAAIFLSLLFLAVLFIDVISNGYSAFMGTFVRLEVHVDPAAFEGEKLTNANYGGLIKKTLREMFPDVKSRSDKRKLYRLVS